MVVIEDEELFLTDWITGIANCVFSKGKGPKARMAFLAFSNNSKTNSDDAEVKEEHGQTAEKTMENDEDPYKVSSG